MDFIRSPPPPGVPSTFNHVGRHHVDELDDLHVPSTSFNSMTALSGRSSSRSSAVSACVSPAPTVLRSGSSSPQQQLVLRGSELAAFTGALREMVRTNHVRATRQQQLNETNAQLHAMNFFLHYCNAERSLRAKAEYEQVRASIEEGRSMLAHMSDVVSSQETALASLGSSFAAMEERAEETRERVSMVEDELAQQKEALASAMAEYEARLAAQERDMRAQEAVLARLLSVRFKMDFGLDVLLALLSWYVAHNSLVRVVANHVIWRVLVQTSQMSRRARRDRTRTLVALAQVVVFALLLRRARRWALDAGLHHAIGSYTKYAQFAAQAMGSTFAIVKGGGGAAISIESADAEDEARREAAAEGAADGHASSHATAAAASPSAAGGASYLHPSLPRPASPDYSASAALSLGRTVGSALLTGLRSGRDSVRWVLKHVVATSASRDMEFEDSGRAQAEKGDKQATGEKERAAAAAAATNQPQPHPVYPHHDVAPPPHTPTREFSQPQMPVHRSTNSAFHTPAAQHGKDGYTQPDEGTVAAATQQHNNLASPPRFAQAFPPSAPVMDE